LHLSADENTTEAERKDTILITPLYGDPLKIAVKQTIGISTILSVCTDENIVSIVPNPAVDFIGLNGVEYPATVTLTDMKGRVLLKKTVSANEKISIGHLPDGVYIVYVYSQQGNTTNPIKLIKLKK
jgi:hypothetical protein